jgi:hypothetical protein
MGAFSTAFTQFFAALTVLFSAFSKLAGTVDNLASVAEESSGQYKDQARIDRQAKLYALRNENKDALQITTA